MRNREEIMHVKFDVVNETQALERIKGFLMDESSLHMVFTPNPEIVMLAQEDPGLFQILEDADLVLADGIGIILASKIKKLRIKDRVTGVDTMDKVLEYCAEEKKSFFIFGGKPGVAEAACKNIEKKYLGIRIAGYQHGYLKAEDHEALVNEINASGADALFVCLGAPKQEKWIAENKSKLKVPLAMGVGGSVDIYAGVAKRAPMFFQKFGLEWLYRLLKEPWRFKRMLVLPKFLLRIIFSK